MTNDRSLGIAALLFSAIMFAFGYNLEAPFAYEPVGPKAFPLLTAAIIAICGLILVIKGGGVVAPNGPGINRGLVLIGVTLLGYALLFQPLGFILSTLLMVVPIAMIFGAKWWQGLITGAVLAVSAFLLFDRVLAVVLPKGVLGGLF